MNHMKETVVKKYIYKARQKYNIFYKILINHLSKEFYFFF